jgi:very-short-patch-repair endonuclease
MFRRFMMYADAVSSGDRAGAEAVLSTFGPRACRPSPRAAAARILAERLRSMGLDVSEEVGMDGCGVDLAIRCGDGRPLGVELDSSVYGTGEGSRTRDCLRRRFLRARGWDVVRTWTPLIWRDADAEAGRLAGIARS